MYNYQKLIICLDAYHKIAGEENALGESWKPVNDMHIYCIVYNAFENCLCKIDTNPWYNIPLSFPTIEMRDKFFEYFKDIILICKNLI